MNASAGLAVLADDGRLVVDALPEERRTLDALIVRGALIVVPERALVPLEAVPVVLEPPLVATRYEMRCTVVILQPGRAVLRLDDRGVLRLDAFRRGVSSVSPPTIADDVVRFAEEADLARAYAALCQHGFIMAIPKGGVAGVSMTSSSVRLGLVDVEHETGVDARLMPHPSGSVAIQLATPSACIGIVDDLRRRAAAAVLERTAAATPPPVAALAAEAPSSSPPPERAPTPAPIADDAPSPHIPDDAPLPRIADVAPVPMGLDPTSGEGAPVVDEIDDDVMPPPGGALPKVAFAPPPVTGVDKEPDIGGFAPPPVTGVDKEPDVGGFVPPPVTGVEGEPAPSSSDASATDAAEAPREPILDGGRLTYFDPASLEAAQHALSTHGALFVRGTHPKNSPDARVVLALDETVSATVVDVRVMAGGPGHVIVEAVDRAVLTRAIEECLADARSSSSSSAAVTGEPAVPSDAAATEAPPPNDAPTSAEGGPVAAHKAPSPPRLVDDALHFTSTDEVIAHIDAVRAHGALPASGALRFGAEPKAVRFVVGDRTAGPVPASFAPMSADSVVVLFGDKDAACDALEHLVARSAADASQEGDATSVEGEPSSDEGDAAAAPAGLASHGSLTNPMTPDAILRVPLIDAPRAEDLAVPSMPVLLRVLFSTRRSFRVLVEHEQMVHKFAIVGGTSVRSPVALPALARAITPPTARYVVEPLVDRAVFRVKASAKELLSEVLRALIGRHSYEVLAAAFAGHENDAPTLTPEGARVLDAIALTPTQLRLVKGAFDGAHPLKEVLASSLGVRAAWELLYLLALFRALAWTPLAKVGQQPGASQRRSAARVFLDDHASKNHFEILGVHWSDSPRKLEPAYRALRMRFQPNSPAATEDAEGAREVREKLEEAFQALQTTSERQRYRKDTVKVKWSQQAEVMLNHAKLAIYRRELKEAEETLEGLLDFAPSAEAEALAKQLTKARKTGKTENDDDV